MPSHSVTSVQRKDAGQFGFLAGAEILERFGPGGNPGPFEDPLELRPQVAVIPAVLGEGRIAIAAPQHAQRPDRGQLVGPVQNRPQLGKERDHAARFTVPPGL